MHTLSCYRINKWSHVCLLCWDMKYNVSCVGGGALKVSHCRIQVWIGAWAVRNNSDKHLIIARYWTKSNRIAAIGWKHRYHTMVIYKTWVWLTLVPTTILFFWRWHLLNAKPCVLFSPWSQYTTRHHTPTVCMLHMFCHVGCAAAWVENFEWEWGILGSQRSWSLENERWKVMFLSSRYSNFKLVSSLLTHISWGVFSLCGIGGICGDISSWNFTQMMDDGKFSQKVFSCDTVRQYLFLFKLLKANERLLYLISSRTFWSFSHYFSSQGSITLWHFEYHIVVWDASHSIVQLQLH